MSAPFAPSLATEAIIYLRLSDFRDEADTTFERREAELRLLAASLGLTVRGKARIENDLNANGKPKGASAYKRRRQETTASGLRTRRTDRPVFAAVLLELQATPLVLIVSDDSRLARDERDGLDLIDACHAGRSSCVATDEEGEAKWLLTDGGTVPQVRALRDRITDARRYSDSIAANARKGRRRWAGTSYQGGRRPFGYRIDPDAPQYAKTLIPVPAEAAAIEHVAAELLAPPHSVAAATRWLKAERIPTVTGAAWSTSSVRDMLLKPAVAGLAKHPNGQLVPAPWPAILDRPVWEQLVQVLTDPARRTPGAGRPPRWLVSLFATCGICGRPLTVGGAGKNASGTQRGAAYVGKVCGHVRRDAALVDDHIASLVVARLEQPDVATILRPPPRAEVDVAGLEHQRGQLADRRAKVARMVATGALADEDTIAAIAAEIAAEEAAVLAQLATAAAEADTLEPFRNGDPAAQVWDALSVPRRRAVVQKLLASVVIERPAKRGGQFDPAAIRVTWNQELAA